MKINLTRTKTEYLDYVNHNSDTLITDVEDNEAVEIRAIEFVDQLAPDQFSLLLDNCVKKLRHGGKLTIGGNEAFCLARQLFRGDIDIELFNKKMYGNNNKMCINLETLSGLLQSKGLNVVSTKIVNNYFMIVEAVRP